jgi:hypothetical protein
MIPVKMNAKPLKQALVIACVSVLLASCGDTPKETQEETEIQLPGAPKVLPDTLEIKQRKKTYVITGIGLSGSNKVAIINNQVLKPGEEVDPGVVLDDVHSTYAIILVGDTKHLLRPGDLQRELDKKSR